MKKGIYLAIAAAMVSGVAVFVSSLASKVVRDPYLLTTSRNIIVAIWFSSILLGIWLSSRSASRPSGDLIDCGACPERSEGSKYNLLTIAHRKIIDQRSRFFSGLALKQWLQLVLIGIIGGSIPFLLFFKGLSLSTATGGQLIHKTLFIWVGLLAVMFLKEKLGKWQLLALSILLIGNYFLATPKSWIFGQGELLIFIATLFWAVETIIAKKVLENIPPMILAWGRMFFGSLIMLGYLAITQKLDLYQSLSLNQWMWIILPSLLLFAYVGLWYSSLKHAPASLVTSILVIASPITTLLSSVLITHKYQLWQVVGSLLILFAIILLVRILPDFKTLNRNFQAK